MISQTNCKKPAFQARQRPVFNQSPAISHDAD
jgi:hypothetical protein